MKKTVIVTGGLGHIGSSFIRNTSFSKEYKIRVIDNLCTQRYCSLFDLPGDIDFEFVEADIVKDDMTPFFKDAECVVHLAALTDAATSFDRPKEVETVNFQGVQKIAEVCAKVNTPLIFISTTSVYGSASEIVDEECQDLKPQSPYAHAKINAENYLKKLGKEQSLRFVSLRFGTIFGISPGMRFHTAVNKFCWQAAFQKPITVWKTALDQKRPYLDLEDAVNLLWFLIKKQEFHGELFNAVTCNTTVGEIINLIKKHVSQLKVEYVDSPIMNQLSYEVRSEKIRNLGFKFSGSIETAISQTMSLLPKNK